MHWPCLGKISSHQNWWSGTLHMVVWCFLGCNVVFSCNWYVYIQNLPLAHNGRTPPMLAFLYIASRTNNTWSIRSALVQLGWWTFCNLIIPGFCEGALAWTWESCPFATQARKGWRGRKLKKIKFQLNYLYSYTMWFFCLRTSTFTIVNSPHLDLHKARKANEGMEKTEEAEAKLWRSWAMQIR